MVLFLENKKQIYNIVLANAICKAKDSKEFWSMLKGYRPTKRVEPNLIDLKTWHAYFDQLFPPRITDEKLPFLDSEYNEILDGEITLDEIINAIKKSPRELDYVSKHSL